MAMFHIELLYLKSHRQMC